MIQPLTNAVRLSNRQYCQLRSILAAPKSTLHIDEIAGYNQLTLGACKRRGLIKETTRKDGVTLTPEGQSVLLSFERADFMRRVSSLTFSAFLALDVPDMRRGGTRRDAGRN